MLTRSMSRSTLTLSRPPTRLHSLLGAHHSPLSPSLSLVADLTSSLESQNLANCPFSSLYLPSFVAELTGSFLPLLTMATLALYSPSSPSTGALFVSFLPSRLLPLLTIPFSSRRPEYLNFGSFASVAGHVKLPLSLTPGILADSTSSYRNFLIRSVRSRPPTLLPRERCR